MTLNEIVFNIRNLIKERQDDTKLSFNQIAYIVNYLRAVLIRREYDKGRPLSYHLEQDLEIVPVEQVDASECDCTPSGKVIVRTVEELPNFVEPATTANLITYVGGIDKGLSTSYQIIPWKRFRWICNSRFIPNMRVAALRGNRVYILNGSGLKDINIRGIFEDPREAARFKKCGNGEPCYTDDSKYPISGWMVKAIADMFFSGEFNVYNTVKRDNTNNSKDEDQQERT